MEHSIFCLKFLSVQSEAETNGKKKKSVVSNNDAVRSQHPNPWTSRASVRMATSSLTLLLNDTSHRNHESRQIVQSVFVEKKRLKNIYDIYVQLLTGLFHMDVQRQLRLCRAHYHLPVLLLKSLFRLPSFSLSQQP